MSTCRRWCCRNSSHAIIEGSGFTDDFGRASVRLQSAAPLPADGFVTTSGRTASWDNKQIESTSQVLFSGPSQITVTPANFSLAIDESQDFLVTVADDLGHLVVSGSSLTVLASNGKLSGDASVVLPDTQNRSWTQFYVTSENGHVQQTVRGGFH